MDERLNKDVSDYVLSRVYTSPNITTGSWRKHFQTESQTVDKLTKFLTIRAKGCFLYVKLILDLIERGTLNLKSSSFKSLPQSLSEIYLLAFNILFPSAPSYETICQILSIALVQLQPVSLDTLFAIFSALHVKSEVNWNLFQDKYGLVSDFLVTRSDGTLMFFHSTFRDWLTSRREGESSRFLCDTKLGHAATAYYISRQPGKITKSDSVLGLIHHLLKANVNKITETDSSYANRDLQAAFVSLACEDVSAALADVRNIYCPITKVSRLLLLAGADPNTRLEAGSLLGLHCSLGHTDLVSLLLEYGAEAGAEEVSCACAGGQVDILELLSECGAEVAGAENIVAAARAGHTHMLDHLLARDTTHVTRASSQTSGDRDQRALVAAISAGHIEVNY